MARGAGRYHTKRTSLAFGSLSQSEAIIPHWYRHTIANSSTSFQAIHVLCCVHPWRKEDGPLCSLQLIRLTTVATPQRSSLRVLAGAGGNAYFMEQQHSVFSRYCRMYFYFIEYRALHQAPSTLPRFFRCSPGADTLNGSSLISARGTEARSHSGYFFLFPFLFSIN